MASILIEGFAPDELLAWPRERLRQVVVVGRPIVFSAGSATVLAEVLVDGRRVVIELAHIDGGGEGVLPTLWRFGQTYARMDGFTEVEWLVHATRCANPNPRLPPLLQRMGFSVEQHPVRGPVYRRLDSIRS